MDNASRLEFGPANQQELVFKSLLPKVVQSSSLICRCVRGAGGIVVNAEVVEAFEQLADLYSPGSRWATFSMIRALELELKEMESVINTWDDIDAAMKLSKTRGQLRAGKRLERAPKGNADGGSNTEGSDAGVGASGVQAIRSAVFLETQSKVRDMLDAGAVTFTALLDLLNASASKMWRAVGLCKFKKGGLSGGD